MSRNFYFCINKWEIELGLSIATVVDNNSSNIVNKFSKENGKEDSNWY